MPEHLIPLVMADVLASKSVRFFVILFSSSLLRGNSNSKIFRAQCLFLKK